MALAKQNNIGDIHFYFFGNLTDFLPKNTNGYISYSLVNPNSVKNAIEAIGVPHVEVGTILKDNLPIDFHYILQPEDTLYVFPQPLLIDENSKKFSNLYIFQPPRFILDVHLGSLARLLRLTGFDTIYENDAADATIAQKASVEKRIVLTRDIGLLKHKIIEQGYWLRSQHTEKQFYEVANRFGLWTLFAPFTHCIACNGKIIPIRKIDILTLIPNNTALYFQAFYKCNSCQRIYWKGSHYEKMLKTIERLKNNRVN